MPRFEITNEDTGVTYEIDGDRPPTQQELAALMNVAGNTSESGQQKIARPDDYNSVLEGLRTALSGATGSYFDEMKAFEQAILNRQDNEEFGAAYDRSLAEIKERQNFFKELKREIKREKSPASVYMLSFLPSSLDAMYSVGSNRFSGTVEMQSRPAIRLSQNSPTPLAQGN